MNTQFLQIVLCTATLQVAVIAGAAEPRENAPGEAQQITRAGEQSSAAGAADFFTGRARIDPIWPPTRTSIPRAV